MEIEGESGGGMVKVVCNGKKVISSISIDPKAVDPDDVENARRPHCGGNQRRVFRRRRGVRGQNGYVQGA